MKKAFLVFATFIMAQIAVPVVTTYILGAHGLSTDTVKEVSGQIANPYVLSAMMLATFLLTVAALYGWKLLLPATGIGRGKSRLPMAIAILLTVLVPMSFIEEQLHLQDNVSGTFDTLIGNWPGILCMTVAGPITEELVFRRALLGSLLEDKVKPMVAIVVSALAFALAHFNPAQTPAAIAIGILLGWIYVRTGNILAPMACHMVNNVLSVALGIFAPKDATITALLGSTAKSAVCSVVCAGMAAALICLFYKKTRADITISQKTLSGNEH